MKELFRLILRQDSASTLNTVEALTNQVLTSHNGEGAPAKLGNIYMADNQRELPTGPPVNPVRSEAPRAQAPVAPDEGQKAPESETVRVGEARRYGTPSETIVEQYWTVQAKEGKVSQEQAQKAIAEGRLPIVSGGAEPATDTYTGVLANIVAEYNDEVDRANTMPGADPATAKLNIRFLSRQMERVQGLVDNGLVDPAEARRFLARLNREIEEVAPVRREGFWMQLKQQDFDMLDAGQIEEWVNAQFDILYQAARGKDATQSSYYEDIRHTFNEAVRFLRNRPGDMARLSELFDTRLGLIAMNSAISTKSIENVQKTSGFLTAHGLLEGLTLDNGRVGEIFSRMSELLEDTRLTAERGNVTPEIVTSLQTRLIDEQFELATRGAGSFAVFYGGGSDIEQRATRIEIERAVRAAYDIIVTSQRLHVIAARGKALFGITAFFSDAGSTFRVFNLETFAVSKWGLFNIEDEKLNRLVKDSLVDEWLETKQREAHDNPDLTKYLTLTREQRDNLGDTLLRELSTVPDFFTSGWRTQGIDDQLRDYFFHKTARNLGKEVEELTATERELAITRAREFALFMRLRQPGPMRDERGAVWERIIKYRPEEIMRLLYERLNTDELTELNEAVFCGYGVNDYDDFKKKFGSAISAVRTQWLNLDDPEQINFAHPTDEQRALLDQATDLGAGGRANIIEEIYQAMQNYITENKITKELFEFDSRFADIYSRVLIADDGLLGKLENAPTEFSDMIPLSRRWSADIGGDALVRNFNDIAAGHAAIDGYINFIKAHNEEEKLKQAEEAANKLADVNGREAQAKVLRHTIGTYLKAAKIPLLMDALGINKLPFEIPATELERIYGPAAQTLSQDELRMRWHSLRAKLLASVENRFQEIDTDPTLSSEEKREKKQEAVENGERYSRSMEQWLEVSSSSIVKRRALSLLLFLMFAILVEGYKTGESVVKEK